MPKRKSTSLVAPSRPLKTTRILRTTTRWHPPLVDPKKQIRLLYLFPGDAHEDIELQVSSFEISTAPAYIAISYTWGENLNHKAVYINGNSRLIWPNAHYALSQMRLHHPGSYVWIDSICIDQNNLDEKGHQVAKMAEIYKGAAVTCAFVGATGSADVSLADFIHGLGEIVLDYESFMKDFSWDVDPGKIESNAQGQYVAVEPVKAFWQTWCSRHDDDAIAAIVTKLKALLNCAYWSRLWIMQEIMLSHVLEIHYNTQSFAWRDIRALNWLFNMYHGPLDQDDFRQFWHVVRLSSHGMVKLIQWQSIVNRAHCTDVRDKVYGVTSLPGLEDMRDELIPDYRLTSFQLAAKMACLLKLDASSRMLDVFGITMKHPKVIELVEQRRRLLSNPVETHDLSTSRHEVTCAKVTVGFTGNWQCSVARNYLPTPEIEQLHDSFLEKLAFAPDYNSNNREWSIMYCGDEMAAIVPKDTQSGDYIAAFGMSHASALLLRPLGTGKFAIIGQSFLLPAFDICDGDITNALCLCPTEVEHGVRQMLLEMDMSSEDSLVLLAQDLLPWNREHDSRRHASYDVEARFARLETRVSEHPKPMARIIEDHTPEIMRRKLKSRLDVVSRLDVISEESRR